MGEKTTSRDQFTCLSIAISFKTKEIDVVSGGGWTDLNREKKIFLSISQVLLTSRAREYVESTDLVLHFHSIDISSNGIDSSLVDNMLLNNTFPKNTQKLEQLLLRSLRVHCISNNESFVDWRFDSDRIRDAEFESMNLDTVDEHSVHTIPMDTNNIHMPEEEQRWTQSLLLILSLSLSLSHVQHICRVYSIRIARAQAVVLRKLILPVDRFVWQ